jgi:hypothetical protein
MADVTTKVCDLCESGDAKAVTIKEHRRAEFTVDLCAEHYDCIDSLREVGRTPNGSRTYRRYRKAEFRDTGESPQE